VEPLGDEVRKELGRFGPEGDIGRVVEAWPEAVGATIARNAWPARIARDGTLHVATRDSIWAFELGQQAGRISERLGELAPPAIRFTPGRIPEPGAPPAAEQPAKPRVEPDPEARKLAATLASEIGNEELRGLVERAVAASLARVTDDRPL
jgi:predicted nucleic acid-binding Zn ribbon protein